MRKAMSTVVVALTLTGCAVAPNYQAPALDHLPLALPGDERRQAGEVCQVRLHSGHRYPLRPRFYRDGPATP